MEQYGLESIRNVSLLSHCGAGKTSLSEAILFSTKAISRLGRVDDGSTTSDYDPAEVKRRISINLSLLPCEWKGNKINILDAPGYSDFVGEVKAGVRVSEGAVVVVCGTSGVEVGTEQSWGYCDEAGLTRLVFVNKMDRENANFQKVMGELQSRFGKNCVAVQMPIGAHASFRGLIDLLRLKSYTGVEATEGDIPSELQEEVKSLREKLVEAVAEIDDALLEKYLGGEELTQEELENSLRKSVTAGKLVPVLAGSAVQNIGTGLLLDAINNYLPSPKEREFAIVGEAGGTVKVAPVADGPVAALVFKTTADPYVGKLTYYRVYQGTLESNSQVWNPVKGEVERIGQLYMIRGKTQEPVPRVVAGDIGAVAKLNVTSTGDTLCTRDKPVKIVPIVFPRPVFSEAVYPKTKLDLDKLGSALTRLAEEDPTLRVHRDASTSETVISGIGDTQIDVAAEKMQRKFGVSVTLELPKVPYRETITVSTKAEYKHKKQTGGHGQYGHVVLELEPLPRGTGFEFVDRVVGGSVPKNYIPAVEKGVNEGIGEGSLAGYPIADVRVALIDGSYHPVDSSEICFKIAGAGALKKGMSLGQPVILEPVMNVQVKVPDAYTGDIMSDLNTKRAQVQGMNPENGYSTIQALVPLNEMRKYAIDLRSITQGRGTFTMEYDHYQETPAHVAQKIIAEKQAEKTASEK